MAEAVLRLWKESVLALDGRSRIPHLRAALTTREGHVEVRSADWRGLKRLLREQLEIEVTVAEKDVPVHQGYVGELPLVLDVVEAP